MIYRINLIILVILCVFLSGAVNGEEIRDRRIQHSIKPFIDKSAAIEELDFSQFPAVNSLDSFITAGMEAYHVPGLSACIVKDGRVMWSRGYGWANINENIPASDTTIYMLASVSKTVAGLALLHLYNQGRFDLDEDINRYLPFEIVNPHSPEDTITFRMLLTHTASLRDNWDVMFSTYCSGDTRIPLEYYVQAYFLPGGEYYDASENFYYFKPGTEWYYCNHNFVLVGYLVQAIAGLPFDEYCRDSLFIPLGMENTSWFLQGLDIDNVAMPYTHTEYGYLPLGHFGYADYPAGALRSTCLDLARHLLVFLQHGEYNGFQVLDSAMVEEMKVPQCPTIFFGQALIWFLNGFNDHLTWRHGGGDQGVSTMVDFCPELNTGIVVLTNGESGALTQSVVRTLYEFSLGLIDSDGDGIEDTLDNCPHAYNPAQEDSDYDDIGDSCDVCIFDYTNDGDNDELCASEDNCPFEYNPLQEDYDGDGYGDSCDNCPLLFNPDQTFDVDADGVGDECDNCIEVYNPGQEDINNDNIGDACCCVGSRGNADCSENEEPDISDITFLIDHLYLSHSVLCCPNEADADASGGEPDISDITRLIDYLYLSHEPLAACP